MIRLRHPFEPLHFLNALGAGGLSVSFFMYLMFITKHPTTPIPTYETIMTAFSSGNIYLQVMIIVAYVAMVGFGIWHIILLCKKV